MRNLKIKLKYKSYSDDILNGFYIPVLSTSIGYFRAVGYFSSSILLNYIKGLIQFINNEGEMKLLISPFLTEEDYNELQQMKSGKTATDMFVFNFESFLTGDIKVAAASKLFLLLIQKGYLDVRIAVPTNNQGLFHEKIGIFIGKNGDKIAIIGSNNETKNATSINSESFNTFCSWIDGQNCYVEQHLLDFNNLWNGSVQGLDIKELGEALNENILRKYKIEESIDDLIKIINDDGEKQDTLNFTPYEHQKLACKAWFNTKNGILKFATGSGKTKTAIMIMEELKKKKSKQLFIIVVPDKTLVYQWSDELVKYSNYLIKCFSDSIWEDDLIELSFGYKDLNSRHQFIVTTNDTFFGNKFQKILPRFGNDYFLIVDECHSWGTKRMLSMLPSPQMRLGLSATPELFFSTEKTDKLFSFFGGIIAEYSLEDAIKDKKLVEYVYHPVIVSFTDEEKEHYEELTRKIVKMIGFDPDDFNDMYSKPLEMLLFKRARIVYGAKNKLTKLESIIDNIISKGRLLIYCGPTSYENELDSDVQQESLTQLQTVNKILAKRGHQFAQYTSGEKDFERSSAIDLFKRQTYSTLVAIKCLDEGVDIPIIERAVILASSTNPREFVQRRGRILRPYPGKKYAEIYDFIVFEEGYESLLKKELERFFEFARIAKNFDELQKDYEKLFDLKNKLGGKIHE